MSLVDDLYEILGVKKDASKDEIKRAYRKKAKAKHPDREGGSTEEMSRINAAYAVLSDADKRAKYDNTGSTDSTKQPTVEELAMQSVAKAFDDMLAEEAPQGNIVAYVSKAIGEAITRYEFEVKKIENYLTKLEQKAKIVSKKDRSEVDLWANVVADRRKRYEQSLERAKLALEVSKKSKEILAEYTGTDPPPQKKQKPAMFINTDFSSDFWTGT